MGAIKESVPGMTVVLVMTAISMLVSLIHPAFDPLVISIILGIFAGNLLRDREMFTKGANSALMLFLPIGIALYGTQLTFSAGDVKLWVSVIATLIFIFTLTYFVSASMGLSKKLCLLIATGLSVCGASAIAVISSIIKPKKEETSISLIAVMLFGLSGIILYPIISQILVLNSQEFAFLTGTTLPMLGQVKIAAANAGPDVLETAVKIKLMRISCLIFLPLAVSLISEGKKKFYVPWFIMVFIGLAIGVNAIEGAKRIKEITAPVSSFFLSSALAAIGFSVDFDSIAEEGAKPLLGVFLSAAISILLIYLILSLRNV